MGNQAVYTVFIVAFFALIIGIGVYVQKKVGGGSSFITADKSIGVILGAGMFAASFLSGSSIIGYTGFLYDVGWKGFASILGTVLSLMIMGCALVKPLRKQADYGVETVPDLLESRYESKWIRGLASLVMVCLYVIFTGVETMGLGKTFTAFLGWPYEISVIAATLSTLCFVIFGGMYAVAVNDTICTVLGIGGIVVMACLMNTRLGGLTEMNARLGAINGDLLSTFESVKSIIFVAGSAAVWGLGNSSHPVFLGQAFAAKSVKSIMKSMAVSSVLIFLFYFAAMILGASSRILVPNLPDPDYAFPLLVQQQLPSWGAAILLTSVASLIISTIASVLLTSGTAMGNDFLIKTLGMRVNEQQRLRVIRVSTVCICFLGMILALLRPAQVLIFQMLNFGASGAVFFVPILLGLYWRRATKAGGIASMTGGLLVYVLWFLYDSPFGVHPVLTGSTAAIILMAAVSLFTKPVSEETLKKFFPK